MRFDTGLWDRLFGRKVTLNLPGPGGDRRVRVTAKWLAQMEREGKIAASTRDHLTAHVLDPQRHYYTETWTVGENISQEQAQQFRDPSTEAVYVLVSYEEGHPKRALVSRDYWNKAKRLLDQI